MLVYSLAKHVPKIDDDYIYLILLHINNILLLKDGIMEELSYSNKSKIL
jgi:hypothetical protein